MKLLPARLTIERKSKSLSARNRFLSTAEDGGKGWGDTVDHFVSFGAARTYFDQRLGAHARDAVIVRHTVQ